MDKDFVLLVGCLVITLTFIFVMLFNVAIGSAMLQEQCESIAQENDLESSYARGHYFYFFWQVEDYCVFCNTTIDCVDGMCIKECNKYWVNKE